MIHAECQQTRELLDSYLSAELLVETNHQILRHLSGCDACRVELERRQRVRALMKTAMPCDLPPPDLVQRISRIPRDPTSGAGLPVRARVQAFWRRFGRERGRSPSTATRSLSGGGRRQAFAGTALATVIIVFLVVAPWRPVSVTASELLARSDQAFRLAADRSDVVLYRSMQLEERHGRRGTVVSRRRIEVWRNAATGITSRRAFDEGNTLVAGEWRQRDGTRTVYRPGSPPELRARPPEPAQLDGDNAWRLDLSATEYASFIPTPTAAHVEDIDGRFLVRYEAPADSDGTLVEATLTLRHDTLRPIEQTIVVDNGSDVREYALSESGFDELPREEVSTAVFEPEPALVGRIVAPPAPPVTPTPDVPAPAPAWIRPSFDTELDAVYRLHRVDAWLRDAPTVSRTPDGNLQISAFVATEDRRGQLIEALGTVASLSGASIEVTVDPSHRSLPKGPPVPPADLRSMAVYEPLRAHFVAFIASRVPPSERPTGEEEARLVDGLVRNLASRTLERSHEALSRAVVLEQLIDQFSASQNGRLSPDAEATWQTMLRDHARAIEHRLEALRLELQPVVTWSLPFDGTPAEASGVPVDLSHAATRLATLLTDVDTGLRRAFGPSVEGSASAIVADPAIWLAISEAERLALEFQRPRPLGADDPGDTR